MDISKFEKVFNVSYFHVSSIREHRRGILPPEEPEEPRNVYRFYGYELPFKATLASKFKSSPPSWIVKERSSNVNIKYKGKLVFTRAFPESFDGIRSLKFTYDQSNIVVGYGSGNIELMSAMEEEGEDDDFHNDKRNDPITIKPVQKGFPITSISFIPDSSKFFAASECGRVYLCTIDPPVCEEFVEEFHNELSSIDVNLIHSNIVTGGKDAGIRIYDIDTSQQTHLFMRKNTLRSYCNEDHLYHSLPIHVVKFHPDYPDLFISGGLDGFAKIWDIRVPDGCIRNINGPYITGDALEIKDTNILTGSFQKKNCLQLWDVHSGRLVENIRIRNRLSDVDGEFVKTIKYFKNNHLTSTIVTGGLNSNVEVIDATQNKIVFRFPVNKSIIAIDTSENYLAYGGYEHLLRVTKYL
ncbi:hypothetical protein FQR65_LT03450 [Abscondita terminalis]|nr:hypothetical protein FQR65_LT03450 [Abscondita terminalis]